ncbi:MAG: maleylpyruvate isomerase family mycothiol-dependent enzyme [Actinobacteria bacterium]|nr:maleylpyruvate isomerase family mycothiol-dependent enzyme [Actinomycetota bacterium]
MDTEEIWRTIDEQRADLAEVLAGLTPAQWETPSLCEGWTVRHVAAHLTHATSGWARFGIEAVRSGFRFDAMMSRMVMSDRRTPDEIAAALRAAVGVRRRPPGTVVADPLMDLLVHGQDIAIPLGITRPMPIPGAVVAAERLWGMSFPLNPRKRFADVAFTATDAPFAVGTGRPVSGPIRDVVLVLSGREAGLAGLSGQAAADAFG